MASDSATGLDRGERRRLAALRAADGLASLVELTGADDVHEAYFAAKEEWRDLRGRELAAESRRPGLPGAEIMVDGHAFGVHGVTHAGTDPERQFLRDHVTQALADGAVVYCEQGIRPLYFGDLDAVCAMDDYRWASRRRRDVEADSRLADALVDRVEGVAGDVDSFADEFQETVFSLIDSGDEVYGDRVARALGEVATEFLAGHEDVAVGDEFESYRLRRQAAREPTRLRDLQHYYERTFLPQPVEREWLRRHDPELELVTHARNERMADYAVHHNDETEHVLLVVGAAHQPGVRYYLEAHRDGERDASGFDPVE